MTVPGLIQDVELQSQALDRKMIVRVITPPGYDGRTVYPVLYFLHPWGLSPRYITDKLHIHHHLWSGIAEGTLPPLVIVLPTGYKSFFVNAADPPGYDWAALLDMSTEFFRDALHQYGCYGDYLFEEVIPYIEHEYSIRTDRAGRAIGGISMGGAAAAVHGFGDPSRFCAVGIHSPALFAGPPAHNGPPWIFGMERTDFAARNPADVAARLDPEQAPRIWLDCGDQDAMLDRVEHLHEVLAQRGIAHHYAIRPGGHDKSFWGPRVPEWLSFYAQDWVGETV